MKKYYPFLFVLAVLITLASCQKEIHGIDVTSPTGGPLPTDSTNTEVGTWNFMSLQGTLSQTAELSQAGQAIKGVSTSNFTSQNNAGTVKFDSVNMTATGITMSVNTTAKTLVYMNGSLFDSLSTPLNQTLPAQDATSGYKKIGTDSLYFQDGGFLNVLTGGLLPSAPSGCKLVFSGNTMKMTIVYDTVTTQNYQGIPAKVTIHAVLVATLQKS